MLAKNVSIVYVCTQLPTNAIKHDHIVYIETGQRWFTHLLFKHPQEIKAVFYNNITSAKVKAKLFASQYGAELPVINSSKDLPVLKKISKSLEQDKIFLIETRDGIGDVLMSLPTAETLHSQGWKVQYLVEPANVSVLDNLDFIDKVYSTDSQVPFHLIKSYISLSGKLSTYGLSWNQQHRIYSVAHLCGIRKEDLISTIPTIVLTESEKKYAKELLKDYDKTVGICWQAASSHRSWFRDYVQQLIDLLNTKGVGGSKVTPIVVGKEKFSFKECTDLAGITSLRQLFAIINELDYVVTVDTGILHIAGALSKPTIALMGYIPAEWRCSTYKKCYPLIPNKSQVPCYPCVDGQWVAPKDRMCQKSASYCLRTSHPQKVIEALTQTSKGVFGPKIDKKSIKKRVESVLVVMPDGELGDKLVALGVISEWRRINPHYKTVDVCLGSERFNTSDGYVRLFRDCADHCFTSLIEASKNRYDRIFNISATGIHDAELLSAKNKELQLSRYQRWSANLGFTFKGLVRADYKVHVKDAKGLQERRDFFIDNRKKDFFTITKLPTIGICPFTSNKTKNWEQLNTSLSNSPKWQEVVSYLSKKCLVTSVHYTPLNYDNCLNLGNLNPNELGYIISKLDLLIGCEAGVTHFAGILNVPMIVLVGSSSPLVLRHYKDVRIVRKGSCHSCNRFIIPTLRDCRCGSLDDNPHSECLTKVTVEDLIEEIKIFKGTYFKKKYKINV